MIKLLVSLSLIFLSILSVPINPFVDDNSCPPQTPIFCPYYSLCFSLYDRPDDCYQVKVFQFEKEHKHPKNLRISNKQEVEEKSKNGHYRKQDWNDLKVTLFL